DLARDQEEPAVRPREDGVVDQFRDRGGKGEKSKAKPTGQTETRGGRLEVLRDRGQGLVHAEVHVPRHAREDQEDDGEFDPDRVSRSEERRVGKEWRCRWAA